MGIRPSAELPGADTGGVLPEKQTSHFYPNIRLVAENITDINLVAANMTAFLDAASNVSTVIAAADAAQASATAAAASEANTLTYKNDALTFRNAAETASTNASTYANNALTSANNANTSATNAAASATATAADVTTTNANVAAADAAKVAAQGYRDQAATSATNAATSATNAANSAAAADTSATNAANANTAAQAAKTAAETAETNAETAETGAVAAKVAAEAARDEAQAIAGGDFVPSSDVGIANGVAPTDATNHIPIAFLPALDKSYVGLGNVDNTADTDKPVSTAQQAALDLKADLTANVFTAPQVIQGDLSLITTVGTTTPKLLFRTSFGGGYTAAKIHASDTIPVIFYSSDAHTFRNLAESVDLFSIGAAGVTSYVALTIPDEAYGPAWDGKSEAASKNAIYDKIASLESMVVGAMVYQGTWNANTNTPAIPAAAAGNKGWFYKVSVAGATSISGITDWAVGDWVVSNGASWDKIDNTETVSSVAGLSGAISAASLKTALSIANVSDTGASFTGSVTLDSNGGQIYLFGKRGTTEDGRLMWGVNGAYLRGSKINFQNVSGTELAVIQADGSIISNGANQNFVARGDATNGGQLVLGYGDNLATAITGQANNTWNVDVPSGNAFRIWRSNAAGVNLVALSIAEADGVATFIANVAAPDFIYSGTSLVAAMNNKANIATTLAGYGITDAVNRTPSKQLAGSNSITPTFSDDLVQRAAVTAAVTLNNPTGTAIDGFGIVIRIKANGAYAISYGTQYRAMGVTLPTATVNAKWLYLGMIFNSTDTKWDVVSVAQEA